MKKIAAILICFLFFSASGITASAAVDSTTAPAAENGIYIAGNPDLYPLEYFDEKTGSYRGILPELYEKISRETGIELIYISAEKENRQSSLAENRQVEIVSAHKKGTVPISDEAELFSYEKDGEKITLCIGFTDIAAPELISSIKSAVSAADKEMWLSAAMELEEKNLSEALFPVAAAAAVILFLAVIIIMISSVRQRRRRILSEKTKTTDPITGIGNLLYFEECFSHHINHNTGVLYYLCYIATEAEKLEEFYDRSKTEELERFAASEITDSLGDNDFCARIGKGTFGACFMAPDRERAIEKAGEIIEKLNSSSIFEKQENNISFRCGIYYLEQKNIPFETAVFNAKQGYVFAEQEDEKICFCDEEVLSRVALKSRLRKKLLSAIENGEFNLYFQFILDTETNRFCGAEVLSRWHSPFEGIQMPAAYIEDLKTAGMIERLDFYMLENICRILEGWSGGKYGNLYLSCNFTRLSLSSESFLGKFEEIISKYNFERTKLVIEITEDSLARDSEISYKNVFGIKKLGCRIAIDDMGSGYTSFSDLCEYPADIIKIDRSIILKSDSERGNAVLKGIIRLGHGLGITVVCEGVEREEEKERVLNAGCDYIQGFLFSRVLPAENAMEYYEKFMNQ